MNVEEVVMVSVEIGIGVVLGFAAFTLIAPLLTKAKSSV